jgi:hypothetical protein
LIDSYSPIFFSPSVVGLIVYFQLFADALYWFPLGLKYFCFPQFPYDLFGCETSSTHNFFSFNTNITIGSLFGGQVTLNGYGGGGIDLFQWGAPVLVSNNLIVDNIGFWGGGVLVDYPVPGCSKTTALTESTEYLEEIPIIMNNTIIYNNGTIGGGIHTRNSTPDVLNNIVWGNTYTSGGQIFGAATVTYSDVEGSFPGIGNIDEHPLFDMGSEFYLLTGGSPCIDAGNPDPQYNDVEDPLNPGNAMSPAFGNLRNDMGHAGGPNSLWCYWDWPIQLS